MSFISSGGTGDVAASDTTALIRSAGTCSSTGYVQASATFVVSGLNAVTHTFTAKYRAAGTTPTATFENRSIIVLPLP